MPNRALLTAATGMQVQQQNLDNIANNLANASTVGFKRTRLEFQDLMYQNMRSAGAAANASTPLPVGLQIGMGARSIASEKIFEQGEIKETNNKFDMLINGSGFFQVRQASGEIAYTRAGQFHLNEQGQMVTALGEQLEPSITIPTDVISVTIARDGTVSTTTAGQANAQTVGQIQLAIFPNPAGLEALGSNLFKATGASGQATVGAANANGIGMIEQGYVEGSNVSVVEELVNMISAQRIYETNSKVITTADRMLGTINQAVN